MTAYALRHDGPEQTRRGMFGATGYGLSAPALFQRTLSPVTSTCQTSRHRIKLGDPADKHTPILSRSVTTTNPIPPSTSLRESLATAHRFHLEGRLQEAEMAYRMLLDRFPRHHELLRLLGVLKYQAGEPEAAVDLLRRAVAAGSEDGRAMEALACILGENGQEEDGIQCLRALVADQPRRQSAFYNLGMLLMDRPECLRESVEALERAVALDARDDRARGALALALLRMQEPERALEQIESVLARTPGDVHGLAHKIAALSQMKEQAGIAALVDLETMIHIDGFEGGDGFGNAAELNDCLARLILDHPSLGAERTTTNGLDTGEILNSDDPAIHALIVAVKNAVSRMQDGLELDADHPFIAGRPKRWHLSGWGVRMWSGGFQVPHYHQDAWISGVYYVRLPPAVRESEGSQAGWIEFGRGTDDLFHDSSPAIRRIQPEEGRLIAFPSYFWHRTLPFADDHERLCISFNVVPGDR